jgi:putative oxidoreductase
MSNHRSADIGLLILRVGAGVMLLLGHGWGKLMHFSERVGSFADPIHLGPQASFMLVVFAEVFCSALVAVGLMTRLAVIPLVIFFLVAGLIQHADDPWNRKELAFLFLVAFLPLLFTGPGRFSIDALIAKRKAEGQPGSGAGPR